MPPSRHLPPRDRRAARDVNQKTALLEQTRDLRDTVHAGSLEVDRAPVTNERYARFVEATGHRPPAFWPNGTIPPRLRDHPVIGIDFFDALAFARWAGGALPTELQWVEATGLSEHQAYAWGDDFHPERCNTVRTGLRCTSPVGAYPSGTAPSGCVDMCGNVWELTCSPHPDNALSVIVKGGSWSDFPADAKIDASTRAGLNQCLVTVGFRLVYGVEQRLPPPIDDERLVGECIAFRRGLTDDDVADAWDTLSARRRVPAGLEPSTPSAEPPAPRAVARRDAPPPFVEVPAGLEWELPREETPPSRDYARQEAPPVRGSRPADTEWDETPPEEPPPIPDFTWQDAPTAAADRFSADPGWDDVPAEEPPASREVDWHHALPVSRRFSAAAAPTSRRRFAAQPGWDDIPPEEAPSTPDVAWQDQPPASGPRWQEVPVEEPSATPGVAWHDAPSAPGRFPAETGWDETPAEDLPSIPGLTWHDASPPSGRFAADPAWDEAPAEEPPAARGVAWHDAPSRLPADTGWSETPAAEPPANPDVTWDDAPPSSARFAADPAWEEVPYEEPPANPGVAWHDTPPAESGWEATPTEEIPDVAWEDLPPASGEFAVDARREEAPTYEPSATPAVTWQDAPEPADDGEMWGAIPSREALVYRDVAGRARSRAPSYAPRKPGLRRKVAAALTALRLGQRARAAFRRVRTACAVSRARLGAWRRDRRRAAAKPLRPVRAAPLKRGRTGTAAASRPTRVAPSKQVRVSATTDAPRPARTSPLKRVRTKTSTRTKAGPRTNVATRTKSGPRTTVAPRTKAGTRRTRIRHSRGALAWIRARAAQPRFVATIVGVCTLPLVALALLPDAASGDRVAPPSLQPDPAAPFIREAGQAAAAAGTAGAVQDLEPVTQDDLDQALADLADPRGRRRDEAERFLIRHGEESYESIRDSFDGSAPAHALASLRYVLTALDEQRAASVAPVVVTQPPHRGLVVFVDELDSRAARFVAMVRRTARAEQVAIGVVIATDEDLHASLARHVDAIGGAEVYTDKGGRIVKEHGFKRLPVVAAHRADGKIAFVLPGSVPRHLLAARVARLRR